MRNILKFETNAKVMVTTQGVGGGVGRGCGLKEKEWMLTIHEYHQDRIAGSLDRALRI